MFYTKVIQFNIVSDDQRIMTFLRGCKFSLEKTKRKLDMYFTMRAALPEFFTNRDVTRPELKDILDNVYVHLLLNFKMFFDFET